MQADIKELATLLDLSEQIKAFMDGKALKGIHSYDFPSLIKEATKQEVQKLIQKHYEPLILERLDKAFELLEGDALEQAIAQVVARIITQSVQGRLNNDGYY